MSVVNKFNVNGQVVDISNSDIDITANNVSYDDSFQYDENTVGNKLSELDQKQIQAGVYDVSSHNDGVVFESLKSLLSSSNLSTLIPESVRRGGMFIQFIQSSDNKYVQYRCRTQLFSTNIRDWNGINIEPEFTYTYSVSDENGNAILNLQDGLEVNFDGLIKTKGYEQENGLQTDFIITDNNGRAILDMKQGLEVTNDGHLRTPFFNTKTDIINKYNFDSCSNDLLFNKKLMQMPRAALTHKIVDKTNRLVVSFNGDSIIGSQLEDITQSPEWSTGAYPPNMSRMIVARKFLDRYQFENADVQYRNLEHSDWIKTGFNVNHGKGDKDNPYSSFNEFEIWGCNSENDSAQITVTGYNYFKLIWSRGHFGVTWSCSLFVSVDGGEFISPSVAGIDLPDNFGKEDLEHAEVQVYKVCKLDAEKTYIFKIIPALRPSHVCVWGCEFWNNPRLDVVVEAFSGKTAHKMVEKMQDAFCSSWHTPMFMISDVLTKNDQSYIVNGDDTIAIWQNSLATLYKICRDNGIPLLLFAPHRTTSEWLTYLSPGFGIMQGLATINIMKCLEENNLTTAYVVNTTDGQHLSNQGNEFYFNLLNQIFG